MTVAARYDLDAIRARLSMLEVCEREGVNFKRAGVNWTAHCPFCSQRKRRSFTIHGNSPEHAFCYACSWRGDIFTFWGERHGLEAKVKGDFSRITEALAGLAGLGPLPEGVKFERKKIEHRAQTLAESGKPWLPRMRLLHEAEKEALAVLRGISRAAVDLAEARRWLGYADWPRDREGACDARTRPSWVITDDTRWTAQFRRLDGKCYIKADGDEIKSWSTRNTRWVIGAADIGCRERVLFVEGGADLLAACHLIAECGLSDAVAACCLFGASNHIAPEARPHFAGKRVLIVADNDEPKEQTFKNGPSVWKRAGIEAAARWQYQLEESGAAAVSVLKLEALARPEVKDLNDLVRTGYEEIDLGDFFEF